MASLNAYNMEKYINEKDIKALYVQAASFPMGVGDAYQKLHSLVPDAATRTHYGVSHMNERGQIIYKAAKVTLEFLDKHLSGGSTAGDGKKGF